MRDIGQVKGWHTADDKARNDREQHPWEFKSAAEWERRDELVPEWTPEDVERLRARIFRDPS